MEKKKEWRKLAILLASIGIANIGDFVYLVVINIIVFDMTGSAAAVAGLWIISPIVNICTKFWTGSFIDYRSKRAVMMVTYGLRAAFIALLPLAPNIVIIYLILVCLSVAQSFFTPASMTYTTMLVPVEKRKRFNAIRSFCSSSAFIVGPAIGGAMILATSISWTLWANALFFVVAAIFLALLPKGEKINQATVPKLTVAQVAKDFTAVAAFLRNHPYITFIYVVFLLVMLFSFAMDTQEVVFTQQVVGLSQVEYSLLVSITGIGSIVGAAVLALFANHIPLRHMIGSGLILMTAGYLMYAFSWSFWSIAAGFIVLGLFNVFVNAGMATFYQNHIPVKMMGRVTSMMQLGQSIFQILFILAVGVMADWFSLRLTIVVLALAMAVLACLFAISVFRPGNRPFFEDQTTNEQTGQQAR
ncbi:MFS transporter [Shouchella clausii]|uniref:MFS transporter n=1 Tax=Shouchella clausii TaxID=79880 RepID=A0A268S0P1_SHOCL|nr:MFS transporter [Shouchella clausii]PAF26074.1 MFS transporter [Shouchella clausii]